MIVLLVGAIVYGVMVVTQRADAERETQWGIDHNTIDSPPVCVWMIVEDAGVVTTPPGCPTGCPCGRAWPRSAPGPRRCWSG
ncbi:hypothetical protein NKH77_49665 [Streptomyces sp. M19]